MGNSESQAISAKILTGVKTESLEIFVAFCMLQVKGITTNAKCFVGLS